MPAMTSSFRYTGKLLNQRHAHTRTHTFSTQEFRIPMGISCIRWYLCYTGVMSQVQRVLLLQQRKRWRRCRLLHSNKGRISLFCKKVNLRNDRFELCGMKRNLTLELPVVHPSFHTTVLNSLSQMNIPPVSHDHISLQTSPH